MAQGTDLVIGIDAGTSVIKAVAFTLAGRAGRARRPSPTATPAGPGGAATQPMDRDLGGLRRRRSAAWASGSRACAARTAALAVTGQGDGTWLVGAGGRPVGDAWLWLDARAAPTVRRLAAGEGERARFEATGTGLNTCQQGAQLAHMAATAPGLLDAGRGRAPLQGLALPQPDRRARHRPVRGVLHLRRLPHAGPTTTAPSSALGLDRLPSPPAADPRRHRGHASADARGRRRHRPARGHAGVARLRGHGDDRARRRRAYGRAGRRLLHRGLDRRPHARGAGRGLPPQRRGDGLRHPPARAGDGDAGPDQHGGDAEPRLGAVARAATSLAELGAIEAAQRRPRGPRRGLAGPQRARRGSSTTPTSPRRASAGPSWTPTRAPGSTASRQRHRFPDLLRAVVEGLGMAMRDCYAAMGPLPSELRLTGGAARSRAPARRARRRDRRPVRVSAPRGGGRGRRRDDGRRRDRRLSVDGGLHRRVGGRRSSAPPEPPDPALVAAYDGLFPAYLAARRGLAARLGALLAQPPARRRRPMTGPAWTSSSSAAASTARASPGTRPGAACR